MPYVVGKSIPDVPFVDLKAVLSAETAKLIFEQLVFVVFLLVRDVGDHVVYPRRTHQKGAVTRPSIEIPEDRLSRLDLL